MRVLLVDDDTRLVRLLHRGLTAEGFAVDIAGDGPQGLAMALEAEYDALVLDVMLPGLDGYRICSRLRETGSRVPILMLTAKDGEYDEADGLDLGADDYVTKPFSYVCLVARLRALIRRGGGSRPAVLTVGDLVVDPTRRLCRRGEVEVLLTAKEFSVLEYLAQHAGTVVSKTEIIEHVWDAAYDGDVNIVEVYVSAIRRKLDIPFGRRSITTVRGVGYRLVER